MSKLHLEFGFFGEFEKRSVSFRDTIIIMMMIMNHECVYHYNKTYEWFVFVCVCV